MPGLLLNCNQPVFDWNSVCHSSRGPKKRISDLEAEKAFQEAELKEAEVRLVRLEAEVAAPLPPTSTVLDLDAQVVSLRAQLQRTEEERDAALAGAPVKRQVVCRGQGRVGHHIPPMPVLIPAELTRWMEHRHSDLQDAFTTPQHHNTTTTTTQHNHNTKIDDLGQLAKVELA